MEAKGREAYDQNNFQVALDCFNQAIDLVPPDKTNNLSIYHFNKGQCYLNLMKNHTFAMIEY